MRFAMLWQRADGGDGAEHGTCSRFTGRCCSVGSQRVRHAAADMACTASACSWGSCPVSTATSSSAFKPSRVVKDLGLLGHSSTDPPVVCSQCSMNTKVISLLADTIT